MLVDKNRFNKASELRGYGDSKWPGRSCKERVTKDSKQWGSDLDYYRT